MEKMSTRHLKIYYGYTNTYQRHPVIRIGGHYLSKMDFKIGDKIVVSIQKNEISIKKVLPSEADLGSAEAQPDRNNLV